MHRANRQVLLILSFMMLPFAFGSAAQDQPLRHSPATSDLREPPGHNMFAQRLPVRVPFRESAYNLASGGTEASEPVPSCASGIDDSIWYQVQVPAGKLKIITKGTEIYPVGSEIPSDNTVVDVFTGTAIDALTPIACNNNQPNGELDAKLSLNVGAGTYIIRVSACCDTTFQSGSGEIKIKFKPSGPIPANDLFENAKKIKLPFHGTTSNIENALIEDDEALNATHICRNAGADPDAGSNSVWYRFTLLYETALTFSTEGSVVVPSISNSDTLLSVWRTTSDDTMAPVGCDDDDLPSRVSLIENLNLIPGDYYVQVSRYSANSNANAPSHYTLKITNVFINMNVITTGIGNGSFETSLGDALLEPWTLKNKTKDKVVCGGGIAHSGDCAFRFKGVPGEKASLSRTLTDFGSWAMNAGDTFVLQYQVSAPTLVMNEFVALVKVTYTDGTPATKQKQKLGPNPSYQPGQFLTTLVSDKFKSVKITFKNKMQAGVLDLDTVGLFFQPEPGAFRSGRAVLPLPPPPAQ